MPIATMVVFIGQSNAATFSTSNNNSGPSATTYNSAAAPTSESFDEWTPDTGIQIWDNTGSSWVEYSPGSNSDGFGGTSTAWGPEASFAQTFRSVIGDPLYIYKLWAGGVGLQQQSGATADWSPLSTGKEWDTLYTNFAAACAASPLTSLHVVVPLVVWLGGETDTTTLQAGQNYHANLSRLDQSLRDRLSIPDTLFIANRVRYDPPNGPWGGLVRAGTELFVEGDERRAIINSDTLTWGNVSYGHYDPPSVVTLGRMIFQAAYERLWR